MKAIAIYVKGGMETWIVSDPEAVANFYGKGFLSRSLPNRTNLEEETKPDIFKKLKTATARTQKGEYAKIKHASKLLKLIAPINVAKRCSRFGTFTTWLSQQIEAA